MQKTVLLPFSGTDLKIGVSKASPRAWLDRQPGEGPSFHQLCVGVLSK